MSVPLRFSSHLKIVPSPPMFCLCGAKGINISGLYLCSLQISPNKTLFETHLKDHERGSMSSMPTFSPNPSSQHSMSIFCGSNKIILCSFLLQNIQTIIGCLLCPSLLKHLLECTMFVPFEASKWRYLVYFSFSAANAYKISLVWWSNLITFPSKPWRSRSCLFFQLYQHYHLLCSKRLMECMISALPAYAQNSLLSKHLCSLSKPRRRVQHSLFCLIAANYIKNLWLCF